MKIKLIIFDLDGVLFEAKHIHYEALNAALITYDHQFTINWDEHLTKYDGLKTNQKLDLLTQEKKLPYGLHDKVWNLKQKKTHEELRKIKQSEELISCMQQLYKDGYKLACCSNSIRKTVLTVLSRLGIIEFMDLILSNEDVQNSKPHPEIFWNCASQMGMLPEETLILEDSPRGLLAASRGNFYVLRVKNPEEVSYNNILNAISNNMKNENMYVPKWKDSKLNVLIPMAGLGSRFTQAGYTFPKPLIDVNNKPMIQAVVDNLNIDAHYVFIIQKEHDAKYNLKSLLKLIVPDCTIVETDGLTEGAACTVLLAKEYINNNNSLLLANSDQYIEWNSNEFMYKMNETNTDGGIVTFKATHPKWSFAKLDSLGNVLEVAEKNPISDNATAGVYFWKKGSDFVKYAERMIQKNVRTNNEFYVCPVYNEAIADNSKIIAYEVQKMWGIGTPEDLNVFLENKHTICG